MSSAAPHESDSSPANSPGEAEHTTAQPNEAFVDGPGSRIGPYKLLQKIGAGGMGVVFMAEQERPVRRRVAFKIIKPGMDSEQIIGRFEAERQALAMMDHQHIAKVLDAGTTATGRPYFVMELVQGVAITKYCDENKLTPRERLELFVPVCQAIQHAHQKGIIHRDIKPSNVLVTLYDGRPVAKVIDFGVAKATDAGARLTERTLFTQFGAIVGTFEYMAPEQAEMSALGVDTRSDIYSLGVLLYELLTGTTPHSRRQLRDAAYSEMVRIIKEEEPPRPSTRLSSTEELATIAAQRKTEPAKLARLIRGELDWIVMKCLEKDRTRRYDTANGLARDLLRYLNDEPVEACPPSVGYKLSKFARKHKATLLSAAAFAGLLVAGIVVSVWLAIRAGLAEADTKVQRDAALELEKKARDSEDMAKRERDDAEAQRRKAQLFAADLLQAQGDLRRTLYATDMNLIQAAWDADNVSRVLELLDRQVPKGPKANDADLRGFEWHYWRRLCHADQRTLSMAPKGRTGDFFGLAILSGDASRCCLGRDYLFFNLDGKALAPRDDALALWDTAAGDTTLTIPSQLTSGLGADFWRRTANLSRDGSVLAWLENSFPVPDSKIPQPNSRVHVWDTRSGENFVTISFAEPGPLESRLALAGDGSRVAVAHTTFNFLLGVMTEIKVWESRTGKEIGRMRLAGIPSSIEFSDDGSRLAAPLSVEHVAKGRQNAQIQIWDVATQKKSTRDRCADAASAHRQRGLQPRRNAPRRRYV